MNSIMRIERLRRRLEKTGRLPYLISDLINVGYLCGFRGSYGHLLVEEREAFLITDSRYEEYARSILAESIGFVLQKRDINHTLRGLLKKASGRWLFVEDHSTNLGGFEAMKKALPSVRLLAGGDEVNSLRMVKEEGEIEMLRKAVGIADDCFAHLMGLVRPGILEWDISVEIEYFYRKNGCRKSSFDSIVASGKGSSMPHYVSSMTKRIEPGEVLLIDMGCEYQGYNSDLTRTVFVNRLDADFEKIYRIVRSAQESAISSIRPGATSGSIDRAAREVIGKAGYGWAFGHSLGHGLGLEVHELPALRRGGTVRLKEGMAVTVEPGIYLPDRGGVRIEDVVLVTQQGCEILTGSSKDIHIL